MNRRSFLKQSVLLAPTIGFGSRFVHAAPGLKQPAGPFQPTWESLQQYKVPDWYRNAKFGIWAHWGAQCEPGYGDWYARGMYQEGSDQYEYHRSRYGHPSTFGFKDVISQWKATHWNPEELVGLYREAGARYFVALANHHDNFDNFDSTFHPWNSTRIGPNKDLIGGWEKAARQNGLHFGVSVHASHAWSWYEVAQRHDLKGSYKGVPYDGNATAAEGNGHWWNGYDPQDLYAQQHPLSENSWDNNGIHRQWNWGNGVTPPSKSYCTSFFQRTIDLINKYNPDLLYFDDTALPLWPADDAGLRIAAHYYNRSIERKGSLEVVINGKILDEQQQKCMVWDIERGQSNRIEPQVWQTDTCIGSWHYDQRIYESHRYKSARTVIHSLIDIVSKNGNLLLSIPVRGDGTIDDDEKEVLRGITAWMKINSECIYDTRPYRIPGEGPALKETAALEAQGFNEGKGKPFTASDIRFTNRGDVLYAATLGSPTGEVVIETLKGSPVQAVDLLGWPGSLEWNRTERGLSILIPAEAKVPMAAVFRIRGVL